MTTFDNKDLWTAQQIAAVPPVLRPQCCGQVWLNELLIVELGGGIAAAPCRIHGPLPDGGSDDV